MPPPFAGTALGLAIGRAERTLRKQRQDVGEQKLLVLLLVIDADLDQAGNLAGGIDPSGVEPLQRLVDVSAIGENLGAGRAGQQSPFRPRLPLALALVVGVEAKVEALVENPVARQNSAAG